MTRAYLSSSELYSVGRLVSRSPQFRGVGSGWSGRAAGVDEHADHDRDLAPVDQVVHHVLGPHVPLLVLERLPVLEDHQGGRDGRVVLRRDVDPVGVLGAGVDLAGERERPADLALRDALLRQRVGPQPVLRIGIAAACAPFSPAFAGGCCSGIRARAINVAPAKMKPIANVIARLMESFL